MLNDQSNVQNPSFKEEIDLSNFLTANFSGTSPKQHSFILNQKLFHLTESYMRRIIDQQFTRKNFDLLKNSMSAFFIKTHIQNYPNQESNDSLDSDEFDFILEENNELHNKIKNLQQKQSLDNARNFFKQENLNDKLADSNVTIEVLKRQINGHKNVNKQLESDINNLEIEIDRLKSVIQKKRNDKSKLKLQIKDLSQQIEELNKSSQSDETESSQKYLQKIESLVNTITEKDIEIIKVNELNQKCTNYLVDLLRLSDEYEYQISFFEEDKAAQSQSLELITNENKQLKETINELNQKIEKLKTDNSFIPQQMINNVSIGNDQHNIPEKADNTVNATEDELNECEEENKKLQKMIGILANYFLKMLTEPNYVPFMLEDENSIINDADVKGTLINNIETIKSMYSCDLESEDFDQSSLKFFFKIFNSPEDSISVIENYFKENKIDEYAAFIAVCSMNSHIIEKYRQLQDEISNLCSMIPREYFIPCKETLILQNYLSDSQVFFKFLLDSIQNFPHFHTNSISLFPLVTDYINELINFKDTCFNKLKRTLRYKGTFENFSDFLNDTFNDLQTEIHNITIERKDNYSPPTSKSNTFDNDPQIEHLKEYIQSLENEQNEYDYKISQYEDTIQELKDEISLKNNEIESQKRQLNQNAVENEVLKNENIKNISLIESNKKTYKTQLKAVIKNERDRAKNEIQKIEDHYHNLEDSLNAIINKKIKKINKMKKELKESNETHKQLLYQRIDQLQQSVEQANDRVKTTENDFKEKEQQYLFEIENLKIKLEATQEAFEATKPPNTSFEYNEFKNQIKIALSRYTDTTDIDNIKIIEIITSLVSKVNNQPPKELNNSSHSTIISSTISSPRVNQTRMLTQSPYSQSKVTNSMKELTEWENWASFIQSKVLTLSSLTTEELRTSILDIIFNCRDKSLLLKSLQSLRIQKQLLTEHDHSIFLKRRYEPEESDIETLEDIPYVTSTPIPPKCHLKSVIYYIFGAYCLIRNRSKASHTFKTNK